MVHCIKVVQETQEYYYKNSIGCSGREKLTTPGREKLTNFSQAKITNLSMSGVANPRLSHKI